MVGRTLTSVGILGSGLLATPNSTASPEGHTNQNASGGLRGYSHPSDKLHHTPVLVRYPTVTDSRNNEHAARSV
jgi:hypothetical protein